MEEVTHRQRPEGYRASHRFQLKKRMTRTKTHERMWLACWRKRGWSVAREVGHRLISRVLGP